MCKKFTNETMYEIILYVEDILKKNDIATIEVLNPSLGLELYSGEKLTLDDEYIYRSYKSWFDLAETIFCKLIIKALKVETIILQFIKLNSSNTFHNKDKSIDKYGVNSDFFKINKIEEPNFLSTYLQCLTNVNISKKKRVLNLGINRADEFLIIKKLIGDKIFKSIDFVGVDYSKSAIDFAKKKFSSKNLSFICEDLNNLASLNLKKSDLIISIGTLQSSSLNFKLLFMDLIQNYLENKGSLILGFPNCRWVDSELIYGAKAPNYNFSEQSILYKDVYFCKKYLQQKKFRVTLSGKYYLFLTATSIK